MMDLVGVDEQAWQRQASADGGQDVGTEHHPCRAAERREEAHAAAAAGRAWFRSHAGGSQARTASAAAAT